MKAIDFKDYIGCECLIYDSTDPNLGTPAIIEGIDIVANKVICERANFDPNIIKLIQGRPVLQFSKEDIIKISMYFFYDLAELGYLNEKGLKVLNFGKLSKEDLNEFSSNINVCLKDLQDDGFVV